MHGIVFTDFVKRYGALFVPGTAGQPLMPIEFLELKPGFLRPVSPNSSSARLVFNPQPGAALTVRYA